MKKITTNKSVVDETTANHLPQITLSDDTNPVRVVTKNTPRKPMVSEQRIREIVQEELAAWEQRQIVARRFGLTEGKTHGH